MDARIIMSRTAGYVTFTIFTRAHGSDARRFTSRGSHVIITRSNELRGAKMAESSVCFQDFCRFFSFLTTRKHFTAV